jgi:protein arginine kinase activator
MPCPIEALAFDNVVVLTYGSNMLICESCQINPATVDFTHVVSGEVQKLKLCAECAAEKNIHVQGPLSLTDILFGLGDKNVEPSATPDHACPSCHMRRSDFRKTTQLGCPVCYETFAAELAPMFKSMHGDVRHIGKVPRLEQVNVELQLLQRQLDDAVETQDFEEAARLRDAVREVNVTNRADAS